jgi:hypothetical protein
MTDIRPILPPGSFFIVGPIYHGQMCADGTFIRKVDHRNGVVDVTVERPDGTIIEAIETK